MQRLADGLARELVPGHVHNAGGAHARQERRHLPDVADVGPEQGHVGGHEIREPGREVVDDGHVHARPLQGAHHVGADVPGPTGHHPGHAAFPPSEPGRRLRRRAGRR